MYMVHGYLGRQDIHIHKNKFLKINMNINNRTSHTKRQTGRQVGRQADRQTDREILTPNSSDSLPFLFSTLYPLISDKVYHLISVLHLSLQEYKPPADKIGFVCFISRYVPRS
jgi:hypothetical protein